MTRKIQQVDMTRCIDSPTRLFEKEKHAIYWLGIPESSVFRTNTYLIVDGDEAFIIDPGNRTFFPWVKKRVAQIMAPEKVSDMILSHQDPDVSASMVDWLEINPEIKVHTSPRAHVLLPYYGNPDYNYVNNEEEAVLTLASGSELQFIPAPFLHFPGAFATYDAATGCLFTGDVFASLNTGSNLWVEDFEAHIGNMAMFHTEYMASNIAARGFTRRLEGLEINAILSQHGCLIGPDHVESVIGWLAELQCGTDIIYPDSVSSPC